ncbi:MAG: folate-binding protein [Candidatus Parabeggiatoa sp. nov. 1]|nr:MAG: folate-binding protein [Gammaproteobacteria bacterium]
MTETWTQYLQKAGARFENHTVIHFGQPDEERQQALHGDIIADLSHLGLIKVTGNDANKFLQGQFTNDVRQVTAKHSQLSAWCSSKGRIQFNFRLFQRDNAYYLLLPRESIESMLKRLRMYVLRANVTLEEVSENLPHFAVAGINSTQILTDCLGFAPPPEMDASLTLNQITVLHIPGPQPRYLVFSETPQNMWECAAKTVRPVGASAWQLLDILAGLPQIVPATAEEFVPQMVNYQTIGGVNFKKGCYTGQEIVARMQYLGTLKRRMYLAKINTDSSLPQPGDALYVATGEQSVGKIVNAQTHPDGGAVALAVIQINSAKTEDIYWQSQQRERLQLMALPYSLKS